MMRTRRDCLARLRLQTPGTPCPEPPGAALPFTVKIIYFPRGKRPFQLGKRQRRRASPEFQLRDASSLFLPPAFLLLFLSFFLIHFPSLRPSRLPVAPPGRPVRTRFLFSDCFSHLRATARLHPLRRPRPPTTSPIRLLAAT